MKSEVRLRILNLTAVLPEGYTTPSSQKNGDHTSRLKILSLTAALPEGYTTPSSTNQQPTITRHVSESRSNTRYEVRSQTSNSESHSSITRRVHHFQQHKPTADHHTSRLKILSLTAVLPEGYTTPSSTNQQPTVTRHVSESRSNTRYEVRSQTSNSESHSSIARRVHHSQQHKPTTDHHTSRLTESRQFLGARLPCFSFPFVASLLLCPKGAPFGRNGHILMDKALPFVSLGCQSPAFESRTVFSILFLSGTRSPL